MARELLPGPMRLRAFLITTSLHASDDGGGLDHRTGDRFHDLLERAFPGHPGAARQGLAGEQQAASHRRSREATLKQTSHVLSS